MRRRPGSVATLVVLVVAVGVAVSTLFVGEATSVVIGLLGATVCVAVVGLTTRPDARSKR